MTNNKLFDKFGNHEFSKNNKIIFLEKIYRKFVKKINNRYIRTTDNIEEKIKKKTALLIASSCVFTGIIWGSMFLFLYGFSYVVLIPYFFSFLMLCIMIIAYYKKDYLMQLNAFLILIFLSPIGVHSILGGFEKSGLVVIWSLIAPFSALIFKELKVAIRWFTLYIFTFILFFYLEKTLINYSQNYSSEYSILFLVMNSIGISILFFSSIYFFVNALKKENKLSEKLLLNILPIKIAKRLKNSENLIVDYYNEATVLFVDIVKFTELVGSISPEEVVNTLNKIFTEFDRLTYKYGVEKIKTIGDSYMLVGGLLDNNRLHAHSVAKVAIEMKETIDRLSDEIFNLKVRIGINTGSVVAGVIGQRKFSYDLWGDAVNIASRMESSGKEHEIQISESTYHKIKDDFICSARGMVSIKGKGKLMTYYLKGIK